MLNISAPHNGHVTMSIKVIKQKLFESISSVTKLIRAEGMGG
jgi:hypothetical protein